jgi:hypothetical protein
MAAPFAVPAATPMTKQQSSQRAIKTELDDDCSFGENFDRLRSEQHKVSTGKTLTAQLLPPQRHGSISSERLHPTVCTRSQVHKM